MTQSDPWADREDVTVSPMTACARVCGHCVPLHWGLSGGRGEVPGTVESSAKGVLLIANWRKFYCAALELKKGFLFTLRMLQIFFLERTRG